METESPTSFPTNVASRIFSPHQTSIAHVWTKQHPSTTLSGSEQLCYWIPASATIPTELLSLSSHVVTQQVG